MATETHEMNGRPPVDPQAQLLLEQYKAYLADLGNIGMRYTTTNGFYVSIVSPLLAILALAKKGEALARIDVLLYLVVPIFACLLCMIWRESMKSYGNLFKRKFEVLRRMEERLPFQSFKMEEELPMSGPRLIKNEAWIPLFLAAPFGAVFLYGLWVAWT